MTDAATARGAFHVMSKPTGAVCNLDCEYCFFLSKEQLYPGSEFRMAAGGPRGLPGAAVRRPSGRRGGERLVPGWGADADGAGVLRPQRRAGRTVRRARARASLHTIQTNGTLLDDEWGAFLAENKFLVGLSIDGPREMHDAYRVDKGGKPTFDRVLRGWEVLRRHGVEWNALTTVNAANADHGREVYRFLRDELGAGFIQFIPIVERMTPEMLPMADSGWGVRAKDRPLYRQAGSAVTHRSVTGEQYGRFLIDVFEDWARHDVGDVFVQMFDTSLAHWMGMDQVGMCVHAKTCGSALALEHNGDLYSCDHYVEPDYLLGNIADGRTHARARQLPRSRRPSATPSSTPFRSTAWTATCGSPATAAARRTASPPPPTASPGCTTCAPGTRRSSATSMPRCGTWPTCCARGRTRPGCATGTPPPTPARGRNDPCTCGSGRKWKRCHGAPPSREDRSGSPT